MIYVLFQFDPYTSVKSLKTSLDNKFLMQKKFFDMRIGDNKVSCLLQTKLVLSCPTKTFNNNIE